MMKSKKLLILLLVVCGVVFASESNFVQFTWDDFKTYDSIGYPAEQNWGPAQVITLKVTAGSTVYLTDKVSSFWWGADIGADTTDAGYNMTYGNYGYMLAQMDADGKITTDHEFHSGTGNKKQLTFSDGTNSTTKTGYELGTFNDNAEIILVMTPNATYPGNSEAINSYDPVNDPNSDPATISILGSRLINYTDRLGNIVVNFGFVDDPIPGNGREFIIGYEAGTPEPPAGQPLPGVLTSCLVGLCATGIAARRRKQSRK